MTIQDLYKRLQADATARGSRNGQVWHEADVAGVHLYMTDTSFGDGPVFRCGAHAWCATARRTGWGGMTGWGPITVATTDEDLRHAMELAAVADWTYRFETIGM